MTPDILIDTFNGKMEIYDGRFITDDEKFDGLTATDIIVHFFNIGILQIAWSLTSEEFREAFKPSDLGLKPSDYGSFADYCSKDDAASGRWSSEIILEVGERDTGGRPYKYFLI